MNDSPYKKTDKNYGDGTWVLVIDTGRIPGSALGELPSGKKVVVYGVPEQYNQKGKKIQISGHILQLDKGTDRAQYMTPHVQADVEEDVRTGQVESSPLERVVDKSIEDKYRIYLGPVAKADMCGNAIIGNDYLNMPAYDSIIKLLQEHDNLELFQSTTDERIVTGLWNTYESAKKANKLYEISVVVDNQQIFPTKKMLREFFPTTKIDGEYKVIAKITRKSDPG